MLLVESVHCSSSRSAGAKQNGEVTSCRKPAIHVPHDVSSRPLSQSRIRQAPSPVTPLPLSALRSQRRKMQRRLPFGIPGVVEPHWLRRACVGSRIRRNRCSRASPVCGQDGSILCHYSYICAYMQHLAREAIHAFYKYWSGFSRARNVVSS
jgi:hypothetical protein